MKERTELRRYEKELLVRAQEVQLEDRHERLQQELRERLADDGKYFYFLFHKCKSKIYCYQTIPLHTQTVAQNKNTAKYFIQNIIL